MDSERCELVQRHATLPTVGQGSRFGVGGERLRSEPAKEAHHGQVELAVTTEARRVDQPRRSVDIDEPVARPQVTVQARRLLEYSSEGRVVSTGAPYTNRYISVLTITDRKVIHWRDYLDPVAVFDALGWPSR